MTVNLGFRHPKCYANRHGGCSTTISGEHYLSLGLIKLFSFDDPDFRIAHGHGFGVPHPVQPRQFKANVLCTTHNTALSPADDAALSLARFLRHAAIQWLGGAGKWGPAEQITVSGSDLERWVLKMLLTHAAAGAFSNDGKRLDVKVPDIAVDVLLGAVAWPDGWGLHVKGNADASPLLMNPFGIDVLTKWWDCMPLMSDQSPFLLGGIAELTGVGMGLALVDGGPMAGMLTGPWHPFPYSILRPGSLTWEVGGVERRVNLLWEDGLKHQDVMWTVLR